MGMWWATWTVTRGGSWPECPGGQDHETASATKLEQSPSGGVAALPNANRCSGFDPHPTTRARRTRQGMTYQQPRIAYERRTASPANNRTICVTFPRENLSVLSQPKRDNPHPWWRSRSIVLANSDGSSSIRERHRGVALTRRNSE